MSSIKSECERIWAIKPRTSANTVGMIYQRPVRKGDLKREGRMLTIRSARHSVVLDGGQIRALKTLLRDVGETRRRQVNWSRCRVGNPQEVRAVLVPWKLEKAL